MMLRFFVAMFAAMSALCSAAPLDFAVLSSPPYGWQEKSGRVFGIYPDIARALARESGLDIRVQVVPFARAAQTVALGESDATLMFANSMTDGKVIEAAQVFLTEQVVQTRRDNHVENRQQLNSMQIGRLRGGCQELFVGSLVAWNFYEVDTQEQGVKMLNARRFDAFCSTAEAIDFALHQLGETAGLDRADRLVLGTKPVWLMLSEKTSAKRKMALVDALQRIQVTGELAAIFKTHLGPRFVLQLPAHEKGKPVALSRRVASSVVFRPRLAGR